MKKEPMVPITETVDFTVVEKLTLIDFIECARMVDIPMHINITVLRQALKKLTE